MRAATDDTIPCTTADGVRLSVRRIPASGGRGPSRGAVILQHGLGSNGLVFDLPQLSFSRHLAAAGFDCFISELRGAGGSERPSPLFGLDEYLDYDVPAILSAVLESTGRERVSWVGHSMGGILMMLHAIDHPDAPIERFVGVGSALDYRPGESVFRKLRPLRPLAGSWLQTFPFARLGQLNGLVSGYGPTFPAEQMNFVRSNVERSVARQILMRGFDDISMRLFDDLDTTFQDQGFSRKHGALHYLSRAKDFRLATCLIAGSRDVQATPEAIDATVQLLSGARILEVVRRGKLYGQEDDYGHIDLLVGKRASREVWPTILSFLCGN